MKSFNILFSIIAILAFATGCMHKEKEFLTPNQPELRQAIHHQTTQENKGGDEVFNACMPPTNLVETPLTNGDIKLSWTGSASTYSVKYYLNGTLIINTIVNQPQINVPLPERNTYEIQVKSICGVNVMSIPLIGWGGAGGSGGTGVLICDDLNNLTGTSGGYVSNNVYHQYTHSSLYTTVASLNNVIVAQSLYTGTGSAPSSPATNINMLNNSTFRFKTPNPNSKNTECAQNTLFTYINMTVRTTNLSNNNVVAVAYCEDVLSPTWKILMCQGVNAELPRLKRDTHYRIKLFSTFSNITSFNQDPQSQCQALAGA